MKLHGLNDWVQVSEEEIKFPFDEFKEKIDALIILNLLSGIKVDFSKLDTSDDVRFSIDFTIEGARLNVMIIEENNAFTRLSFSFFALMNTQLYEHIACNYGVFGSVSSNEDIKYLLIVIEKILNDFDKYSAK